MNTREKYDEIIELIEIFIIERVGEKAGDIADKVVSKKGGGLSLRDISTIVGFMTGDMLIPYIKKRQLNKAYNYLVKDAKCNMDTAIAYTGLSDQPAFIKAFNKQFNMTPSEARRKRDSSLISPPQTWSVISIDESIKGNQESMEIEKNPKELRYGIDSKRFELLKHSLDLQVLFGFSDKQSEAAFYIADKNKIEIRAAFNFVDEFTMHFYDEEFEKLWGEKVEGSRYSVTLDALFYTYCKFKMSFSQSIELIDQLAVHGVNDITIVAPELIEAFQKSEYALFSFKELNEFFNLYKNENVGFQDPDGFDDFMELVLLSGDDPNIGIEIMDAPQSGVKAYIREDYDLIFDEWAETETNYLFHHKFEREPDMDNYEYEEDDVYGDGYD